MKNGIPWDAVVAMVGGLTPFYAFWKVPVASG
jgi:hypothetical protein